MSNVRRRIGGAAILVAAAWFGRETLAWLLGKVLDLATDGAGNVSLAAFPWQNSLALLLSLVGGYLAFWPSKKAGQPTAAQRAHSWGIHAHNFVGRISAHRAPFGRVAEARDPLAGIIQEGISFLLTLDKEGFSIPNMSGLEENERCAVCLLDYFNRIGPLLRDGHIEEARFASEKFAEFAIQAATEIQLGFLR